MFGRGTSLSHLSCVIVGRFSVIWFRPLPWEYGIRNLLRRPLRSCLTLVGLTTVIVLILVVVGFIRGLEKSLVVSGDPQVAIVYALGMGENLEYSSIPDRTDDLLRASLNTIQQRYGKKYVSPELYLGTQIGVEGHEQPAMGLVRGVTPAILLVRRQVEIVEGRWPKSGEILVGRLAATKMGATAEEVSVGKTLTLEGRPWRISGIFSACGSVFESEAWCRLGELQQAMKRQDLSLVALTMTSSHDFRYINMFCKEQINLEVQAIREPEYYAKLQEHYDKIQWLAWLVVLLVSGAGVFTGLNTMYGAVLGRIRELSTLQTIGFSRRAIVISLIQEGVILAAAGCLLATVVAFTLVNGAAVRFTMGAFTLQIDSIAVLIGCGTGILLGLMGSIPPAIRALRMPVVDGLKSI